MVISPRSWSIHEDRGQPRGLLSSHNGPRLQRPFWPWLWWIHHDRSVSFCIVIFRKLYIELYVFVNIDLEFYFYLLRIWENLKGFWEFKSKDKTTRTNCDHHFFLLVCLSLLFIWLLVLLWSSVASPPDLGVMI